MRDKNYLKERFLGQNFTLKILDIEIFKSTIRVYQNAYKFKTSANKRHLLDTLDRTRTSCSLTHARSKLREKEAPLDGSQVIRFPVLKK